MHTVVKDLIFASLKFKSENTVKSTKSTKSTKKKN